MTRYILGRVLLLVPTLLGASLAIFAGLLGANLTNAMLAIGRARCVSSHFASW